MKIYRSYLISIALIAGHCFAGSPIDTARNKSSNYHMQPIHMKTRWALDVNPENALREYPRPQMKRKNWQNLNGLWEYAITDSITSFPKKYDGTILVPYPIESALSGVQKKLLPEQRLWYKRTFSRPSLEISDRLILNFGAVDWEATIFINNKKVANHTGGYQNFSIDITDYLIPGNNEVIVKVFDPSDTGLNPHGKQVLNPTNIYYTPSSGIWQTVWLEKVSYAYITNIKATPDIDKSSLNLIISTTDLKPGMQLEVIASTNGKSIITKKIPLTNNRLIHNITLPITNQHFWSPDDPFLYDLSVKLSNGNKTIDRISSYFGMRKIDIQKDEKGFDRIYLNNKYTYNLGVLDQGFWPEGLYTAPTDEALAFDIKAIKSMGFNTIRKHIKIEPERWYYYADKIGMLIWQDFVNPPHDLPAGSKAIFETEVQETINQLYNHPSIITWVLFNERWGAYDQQRLSEWIKNYDPSRLINGHSGELLYVNNQLRAPASNPWISSDMTDIHAYPNPQSPPGLPGKARVLGEFGGIGVPVPGHEWNDMQGWGYIQATPIELKERYEHMGQLLKNLEKEGLSASIYTQPFDVEGEENGFLTYDREIIKIPVTEIRSINKNLIPLTSGFSLDPNFKIAANIDVNDNDSKYAEMLDLFKKGVDDSVFLRRLTLMAIRKKDQLKSTEIGNKYINMLTDPYARENLAFISKITRTTRDRGFEMFNTQADKINSTLGYTYAEYKVKELIENEEVAPYLAINNTTPNWDSLQKRMSEKYGLIGEELILGKRMYYYATVTSDWKNFGKYYILYFKSALKRPDYITNNISWSVFEHVDDPKVLQFAVEVMKNDLATWDMHDSQAHDTYANLLYKLKNSSEAIKWEEKALLLKKNEDEGKVFAETLQKMKAGQPTWPQNN